MFGGDPRDVLSFCPKDRLIKVGLSIDENGKECNICSLKESLFRYNNFVPPVEDKNIEWVPLYDPATLPDDIYGEDAENSEEDTDYYYSNGIECDICPKCYEIYPNKEELDASLFFYSMIYEHAHYYPFFPETKEILKNMHGIIPENFNVNTLQYRGCRYLDSMASYNTMLECMDMFNLSLNDCLRYFIESVETGKRQTNLSALEFGENFPGAPLVIYKFLEKFIRYVVIWRMPPRRPDKKDLTPPDPSDEDYPPYEKKVENYQKNIALDSLLREYPNKYKICRNETWDRQDIHLVNYMYYKCYFEEKDQKSFLGNFDYNTSVNDETQEILLKFLDKYKDTYTEPKPEDYEYTRSGGRKCIIGDNYGELDECYRWVKNENVFLFAIRKFALSINVMDVAFDCLRDRGLPRDVIKHLFLLM